MGRRLVANILESDTLELAGAVEYAESPFLGQDAGAVAGCGNAGVAITADLAGALKGADAVINFATAGVVRKHTARGGKRLLRGGRHDGTDGRRQSRIRKAGGVRRAGSWRPTI